MQSILICLFIAVLMPIIVKLPLAIAQHKAGGYDNSLPRIQQSQLTGFGARAKAGHENAFEALIFFAPGVLALVGMSAVTHQAVLYAQIWVVARVIYHLFYLINVHILRSVSWAVSYAMSLLILWQAIQMAGVTLE
ncbi:MAPEG family protein [Neptunicella marina]|uniref:MAPEG family protein n=1 Tax=Neptunicella marina TaxID=2125989 RepID=A0A8J6IT51_9ALTE|nr:MAPEG family protein [Neptunicella marina]MBC3765123.1 MAPEG family protein [Neptunicella marina]